MRSPDTSEPTSQPDGSGPPSRRLVSQARDKIREAAWLLKRRARAVGSVGGQALEESADEVARLLGRHRDGATSSEELSTAVEALETVLETHFGPYRKSMLREYLEAVGWAVGLALLIRSFLFEAFSIPSGSMIPTLEIGDRLFVNKIGLGLFVPFSTHRVVHWSEPERGDVIVFQFRMDGDRNDGEDYIKRVVAVPGDRIRMEQNRLILNHKPVPTEQLRRTECPIYRGDLDEPDQPTHACACVQQKETMARGTHISQHLVPDPKMGMWGECRNEPDWPLKHPPPGVHRYFGHWAENANWPDLVVPEGHVFVMGDNRDRSEDGRFWGLVPYDRIKGTAFVVWWARDKSRMFSWLG